MNRPNWLKGCVEGSELDRIEQMINDFEHQSPLEIVPVIVHRSSTVGHVPIILMLIFSLGATLFIWDIEEALPAGWIGFYLLFSYFLSLVFALWLGRFDFIQRWLTPHKDEVLSAQRRAQYEFAQQKVYTQSSRFGVLLLISMMEHQVVWLPDEGAANRLSPDIWPFLAQKMSEGLKRKKWVEAFQECLKLLAEECAKASESLPGASLAANELGNTLRIGE